MKIKSFFKALYNMKIFYKLIISYFFAAVIPVIIISFVSYNASISHIRNQSISNLSQIQEKQQINILNNLNRFQLLCDSIYYDQKLQNFMLGTFQDINPNYFYEQNVVISGYIAPKLYSSFAIIDKSLNLSIVRYKNNPIEVIKANFDNILQMGNGTSTDILKEGGKRQNFQIYNVDRLESFDWFKKIRGTVGKYRWMQLGSDKKYNNISLVREMKDFNNPGTDAIGLVKLTVRLEDILGEEKLNNHDKGFSLFFDDTNSLISPEKEKSDYFSNNKQKLMQCLISGSSSNVSMTQETIILKNVIPSVGWNVLSIYPIKEYKISAERIRNITLISCMLSLVILFIITYRISSAFSNRITNLYNHITLFENENVNYSSRLNDAHLDELGYLARAFNKMADRIRNLIRDVYQANIAKKESDLKALQAQINPHFLYNSFSAVNRLAELGDLNSIDFMIKSLTKYYRMTLNGGRNIISVSDELEQVKAYLDIYKVRKGDYFNLYYDIDSRVLEYSTVKVILQPFVENIFEHAIYDRTHPINIKISAQLLDDHIIFKIIDDGVGINRVKAPGRIPLESSSGYGVKNVNERIILQYGKKYGVHIFSRPGIGTTVMITIPALK